MTARWRGLAVLAVFAGMMVLAGQGALNAQAGGTQPGRYGFFNKGEFQALNRSDTLVALPASPAGKSFAARSGLRRDPMSDRHAVQASGLEIYQFPPTKDREALKQAVTQTLQRAIKAAGLVAQPVFEQGGALMIPGDEVVVGFPRPVTIPEAQAVLAPVAAQLGLRLETLRAQPVNAAVVKITDPADARACLVAQALSRAPGVRYSEPNLFVHLQRDLNPFPGIGPKEFPATPKAPIPLVPGSNPDAVKDQSLDAVQWVTLVSEGFEANVPGWSIGIFPGAEQAYPVTTTARSRSGNRSVYMTGQGPNGVPPPGPYPNNARSFLDSPRMNLAAAEEAYVEFWFYQKTEAPGQNLFDYTLCGVIDVNTNQSTVLSVMAVPFTGDMTADPTTRGGWRRALARIPPAFRTTDCFIRFLFISDGSVGAEGCYIDDVRIVATVEVDSDPLTNDPYSGRQYELQNQGQIAGLGNTANDLQVPEAWALQPVSPNVVLCVLDDGVDLGHPDLNLVQGYNWNNTPGGGPMDNESNHGTACSGNAGAIANNNLGVAGTAPGVKIMPVNWGNTLADFALALNTATVRGAKIISNSWGWQSPEVQAIEDAIAAALQNNIIVLFAAANGPDRPPYTYNVAFPGRLTARLPIICVGATSPTDEHKNAGSSDGLFNWGSSFIGPGPDVCAPGPWSYTTDRRGAAGYNQSQNATGVHLDYTHNFGGTSSSTPKVAGIAALMVSKNPSLTPVQARTLLRNTARDIEAPGEDDLTGAGRVDARRAVAATPLPLPPRAPSNLRARARSRTVIRLTWRDNSNDEDGFVLDVKVGRTWRRVQGMAAADSTMGDVQGLRRNTKYSFRLRAINAIGESRPSNTASTKTKR